MNEHENDGEPGTGEIILYTAKSGAQIQLRAVDGTVWLTQAQLAALYDTSAPNIVQTIRRILDAGEMGEATINSELIVRQEGDRQGRREVKVYNLDMILAVGYRVTTVLAAELLKHIRDIRSWESRFYLKVKDVFAATSKTADVFVSRVPERFRLSAQNRWCPRRSNVIQALDRVAFSCYDLGNSSA